MFKIYIDLSVHIADCPKSGLAALDFRRANDLPSGTDNLVVFHVETEDEDLCRVYADDLDSNANLNVIRFHRLAGYKNDFGSIVPHSLPASAIVATCGCIANDRLVSAATILLGSLDEAATVRAAKQAAQEAARKANQAAEEAAREKIRQANQEERARNEAALRDWAEHNGSDLLKDRVQEDLEWKELARKEWSDFAARVIAEWEPDIARVTRADYAGFEPGDAVEHPDPQPLDIELLRAVRGAATRQKIPHSDIELIRIRYTEDSEQSYLDDEPTGYTQTEVHVTALGPDGVECHLYFKESKTLILKPTAAKT